MTDSTICHRQAAGESSHQQCWIVTPAACGGMIAFTIWQDTELALNPTQSSVTFKNQLLCRTWKNHPNLLTAKSLKHNQKKSKELREKTLQVQNSRMNPGKVLVYKAVNFKRKKEK